MNTTEITKTRQIIAAIMLIVGMFFIVGGSLGYALPLSQTATPHTVTVIDSVTGQPVVGAYVFIYMDNGQGGGYTDSQGQHKYYTVEGHWMINWTIRKGNYVTSNGQGMMPDSVALVPITSFTYQLTSMGVGSGTLKNPSDVTWLSSPGQRIDNLPENSAITLIAIPSTGWTFDHWASTFNQYYDPHSAGIAITLTDVGTLTAYFTQAGPPPPSYATVTITKSGQGTISPSEGTYTTYVVGSSITLTVTAASGWRYEMTKRNGIEWSTTINSLGATENIEVVFVPVTLPPETSWVSIGIGIPLVLGTVVIFPRER